MGKKINFDEVINGEDYLVNSKTGVKRIYSENKKYLHVGERNSSIIGELTGGVPLPTLNDLFGCKTLKDFMLVLENIYVNKLGFTKQQFNQNLVKDPPILTPLYGTWQKTRDPNWLYNLKDYAFETLHCNLYVTVKLNNPGGTDRFSTIKNTLNHLEMLDYDKTSKFNILDLCSGMGLTTLMLAKRFPNACVYYNELNPASRTVFSELLSMSGLKNIVMLKAEEIEENVDVICAFEAVEHIPHPTRAGVGQPMEWLDKFLGKLNVGGHFLYETMWNAEWSLNGNVLGHFLEYEFDSITYGKDPDKRYAEFHKIFQSCLRSRRILRLDGKTSLGYNNKKWGFRGGPKVYLKTR